MYGFQISRLDFRLGGRCLPFVLNLSIELIQHVIVFYSCKRSPNIVLGL